MNALDLTNNEVIAGVALRTENGKIWSLPAVDPNRHSTVMDNMYANGCTQDEVLGADQGFTTNKGRYVGRREAFKIAKAANQIKYMFPGGEYQLYSEHLYTKNDQYKIK